MTEVSELSVVAAGIEKRQIRIFEIQRLRTQLNDEENELLSELKELYNELPGSLHALGVIAYNCIGDVYSSSLAHKCIQAGSKVIVDSMDKGD